MATPHTTIMVASRRINQIAEPREAPSAILIPISRVRCETTNDMTP